jgi:DNA-binding NarL/FixJ family response regulator
VNLYLGRRVRFADGDNTSGLMSVSKSCQGSYALRTAEEPSVTKSVLIVDDHEAVRRELRRAFQSHVEFTVCGEAEDGAEAIAKAEQMCPDLIVLDLAMPEMNGLEAAGALRFILPDAILFLLTAYKNRELELAAFQSGIRAVFSKYDDLDGLLERARLELKMESRCDAEPRLRSPKAPGPAEG